MEKIKIVLIDDHPLFRQGVTSVLSLEDDLVVVGETSNGEDGLELIRKIRPHIAIIDINLPGISGHQVAQHVLSEKLPTQVIFLTGYDDLQQRRQAIQAGAAAYCTKDIQPEELVRIIRDLVRGKA